MDNLRKRFPVYSKVITLYPRDYNREYKGQILQATADALDDTPTASAKFLIWLRIAADTPLSIGREQRNAMDGAFMHETPQYVSRSSAISVTLLVPFFCLSNSKRSQ
jgi:hypothetical protein